MIKRIIILILLLLFVCQEISYSLPVKIIDKMQGDLSKGYVEFQLRAKKKWAWMIEVVEILEEGKLKRVTTLGRMAASQLRISAKPGKHRYCFYEYGSSNDPGRINNYYELEDKPSSLEVEIATGMVTPIAINPIVKDVMTSSGYTRTSFTIYVVSGKPVPVATLNNQAVDMGDIDRLKEKAKAFKSPNVKGINEYIDVAKVVTAYERAYKEKDFSGIMECLDRASFSYEELINRFKQEAEKYEYMRMYSKQKKIERGVLNPNIMHVEENRIYIAYNLTGNLNTHNEIQEFHVRYTLNKTEYGKWRISLIENMKDESCKYKDLALNFKNQGRVKDAIKELKKSMQVNPNYSAAYSILSDIYFSLGQLDKAIINAEKAVSLQQDIAYYHFLLGMLHSLNQQKDKAMEEFVLTERLDPEFPQIEEYLTVINKEKPKL